MSWIEFEKPYEECLNSVGYRGQGKSNLIAYLLQKDLYNRYILVDTAKIHNWTPSNAEKQEIVRFRKGRRQEQLENLLERIYEKGNTIVIIEEIDMYQTCRWMPQILDEIINVGRNRGIALWLTFRRPQKVHNDLIENADHHFIFKIFGTGAEWYKKATGFKFIDEAKNLEKYHFLYWKVGKEMQHIKPVDKVI